MPDHSAAVAAIPFIHRELDLAMRHAVTVGAQAHEIVEFGSMASRHLRYMRLAVVDLDTGFARRSAEPHDWIEAAALAEEPIMLRAEARALGGGETGSTLAL